MSRTHRSVKYRPFNKEGKWARQMTNQCVRYHNRDVLKAVELIAKNRWEVDEDIFEDPPRTSGWETW